MTKLKKLKRKQAGRMMPTEGDMEMAARSLTNLLEVAPNKVRIGASVFSFYAKIRWKLDTYDTTQVSHLESQSLYQPVCFAVYRKYLL